MPPSSAKQSHVVRSVGPSSTLVNIAEHAELRLIGLLSKSASSPSFQADCESCIANAEASRLIRTIVLDRGALTALFNPTLPLEDAVSAFGLLAALLDRVEPQEEQPVVAMEMADAVVSVGQSGHDHNDQDADTTRVVAMLCTLYNLRSNDTDRCRLVERIVRESRGTHVGLVKDAERALSHWTDVPTVDRRQLWRALADRCDAPARKQGFWLSLLETYDDPDAVDTDEVTDIATKAAVEAVRDPVTLFAAQRGMLKLPAVKALQTKDEPLYDLLKIFQEGKLTDFRSFLSNHPQTLSTHDLTEESCTRHMRVLSLCSLATDYGDEIPYAAVAQTLDVPPTDVESWVIAAVASGLLTAKMDQLQQKVMVERCVVRQLGPAQWKAMQAKIHNWKKNVKSVLDGLQQQQMQQLSS